MMIANFKLTILQAASQQLQIGILILLMTTRLNRFQKLRTLKQPNQNTTLKLPSFDHATIDVVPNVTALPNTLKTPYNDPLSSRGLDSWNLNNNLKQFSETRQLGFFKNRQQNERHKSNPYIIHKVRTPDVRIKNRDQEGKETEQTQGDLKKIEYHTRSTVEQEKTSKLLLENVLAKQQKMNTTKYNGLTKMNTKNQIKKQSDSNLSGELPLKNPIKNRVKSFRRNRFEMEVENSNIEAQKNQEKQRQECKDLLIKSQECQAPAVNEEQSILLLQNQAPRAVSFEHKKRSFHKAIESINRGFLSKTDTYFDHLYPTPTPQPQVQLVLNIISQPERAKSVQERSSQQYNLFGQYDFCFDEELKPKVKVGRRKNKQKYCE